MHFSCYSVKPFLLFETAGDPIALGRSSLFLKAGQLLEISTSLDLPCLLLGLRFQAWSLGIQAQRLGFWVYLVGAQLRSLNFAKLQAPSTM